MCVCVCEASVECEFGECDLCSENVAVALSVELHQFITFFLLCFFGRTLVNSGLIL